MVTKVYIAKYTESGNKITYWVMFVNAKGGEMSPYKTPTKENAVSEGESWAQFFGCPYEPFEEK